MRSDPDVASDPSNVPKLIISWAFVGIPLLWGVCLTLANAVKLFQTPS